MMFYFLVHIPTNKHILFKSRTGASKWLLWLIFNLRHRFNQYHRFNRNHRFNDTRSQSAPLIQSLDWARVRQCQSALYLISSRISIDQNASVLTFECLCISHALPSTITMQPRRMTVSLTIHTPLIADSGLHQSCASWRCLRQSHATWWWFASNTC